MEIWNKLLVGKDIHGANRQGSNLREKRTLGSANIKNTDYVKRNKIFKSPTCTIKNRHLFTEK